VTANWLETTDAGQDSTGRFISMH